MFDHKGNGDKRDALFGGEGSVTIWNLMGARQMRPFREALACTLSPAGRVGKHLQREHDEIVIGIHGHGEARVDGARHSLEPFDIVHLPLGSTLEIMNLSTSKPLHYLIVKAGPEAVAK